MKSMTINRRKSAPARGTVKKSTQPPRAERQHKIIMNIFGKRFELTNHVEVRQIRKGPAKVIEMPRRRAIEP